MKHQLLAIRLPPDFIDRADELTRRMHDRPVLRRDYPALDLVGTLTRSHVLRLALQIGLQHIEEGANSKRRKP